MNQRISAEEFKARTQPKPKGRKGSPEYEIQKAFVKKVLQKYPHLLIFSDAAAHVAKTLPQQARANSLQTPGEKWPDVQIAEPSFADEVGTVHFGLFLECKSETPYKKDGVALKKNPHVFAQAKTMRKLQKKGYACSFFWTVEQGLQIVEDYLMGKYIAFKFEPGDNE